MDLTTLSDEAILAGIGQPSASSGFSGLSDADILAGAGLSSTTPVPEVSTKDYALGALKGVAKAGTDILTAPADLLFRGGNEAIDYVTGRDTDLTGAYPSDYRDRFVEYISEGEGNKTAEDVTRIGGNVATLVAAPQAAPSIAAKVPILGRLAGSGGAVGKAADLGAKAIGYGAEGAGYGALFAAKDDRIGEEAATGAGLNIAIPATLKILGNTAGKLAGGVKDEARRMLLKAFGAGKGRIKKVMKKMPDLLDDAGDFQNPITDALDDFSKAGGGKSGDMRGEKLLSELQEQYDDIAGRLSTELTEAQTKQKDVIIPTFKATEDYVARLPGAQKKQAQKVMNELVADTVNNTDGTILSLQAEKQGLGKVIRETAWGEDAAGQLRSNIIKRIYADLRRTVEDGYSSLTKKPGTNIKRLNQELGQKQTLFPIFEDMIASGESRTMIGSALQSLRTSGGVGQTLIAASTGLAGGLPVGIAAVLGNMAVQSPRGMNALARNLSNPQVKSALVAASKGLSGAAGPAGRLAATFAEENPDRAVTPDIGAETALSTNTQEPGLLGNTSSQGASAGDVSQPAGFLSSPGGSSDSLYRQSSITTKDGEGAVVKTSDKGVKLIKEFEGLRTSSYDDGGGVQTIGYGHTGEGVDQGNISEAEAEELLRADLETAENAIESLVEVPLKQSEFDALVSFVFNVGQGALAKSTLLKKLNAGDKAGAAREFAKWKYAKGKELSGLKRRRAAEKQLFMI